ncbi:MAG: cysteine desulfurase [Bacteroidales bacterium]|nr:cysteine desulfurase [Bacteroidales bacterium]
MLDITKIRSDFPILNEKVYGKPLVYFDNGATSQKPKVVIDKLDEVFRSYNSNIHRGVHYMSDKSSEEYELARTKVQKFINAKYDHEVIFTAGTTASINSVAFSFGERFITEGDEIIISHLEHHANIVPWQMLCERKKAKLKVVPINDKGEIIVEEYYKLLSDKTKIVAISQVSNVLGTITPLKEIISAAHNLNIPVLVDGAQGIQHGIIDVQELDCDFYVFSGHKVYGPTGIGVLYGKEKWLDAIPPYQGGGDMVDKVTFEKTTYNVLPFKFEAGTTNYPGAIGLGTALDYIENIGRKNIEEYENDLEKYATRRLKEIDGVTIYGDSDKKAAIISFLIDGVHQYDTGMILDKLGIAVRTGTHCAQPVMERYGIEGTVRASMCFYNTKEEVDKLAEGIKKVKEMFL